MKKFYYSFSVILLCFVFLTGCASTKTKKDKSPQANETNKILAENYRLKKEMGSMQLEIDRLNDEFNQASQQEREKANSLARTKRDLESKLKKEISDYQAKLEMTEKGLVVTFLAEVFFDSGKTEIKEEAKASLDKVGKVIEKRVPDNLILIEGYTDNVPIKYSGWTSNWELASARALSVLHFFIDQGEITPEKLSAISYGEYRPVASNDTAEGRQQNRRVEIVIVPQKMGEKLTSR